MALLDDAPEVVRVAADAVDIYRPPNLEELSEREQELLDRLYELECITCGNDLGATAEVLLAAPGIVGCWCCGQCLSDMHVVGWLQETHGDISTAINFRGGEGGN